MQTLSVFSDAFDCDGVIQLFEGLGLESSVSQETWRLILAKTDKLENLLKMLAETQELYVDDDALSEILEENTSDELSVEDMNIVAAAGSPKFQQFLKNMENNDKK